MCSYLRPCAGWGGNEYDTLRWGFTALGAAQATMRASAAAPGCGGRATDAQAKLVANALVMEALQRNTLDNITVIALLLQWD